MFVIQNGLCSNLSINRGLVGIGVLSLLLATGCHRPATPTASASPSAAAAHKPAASPLPAPARTRRPEASMRPVRILNTGQMFSLIPKDGMEYLSEVGTETGGSHAAIAPIDQISQWLFDQKYKCINTMQVPWTGAQAVIRHQTLGDKRAVIECRGDCQDIRYGLGAQAILPVTIDHFGLSQPLPVLHLHGPSFGGYTAIWTFNRPNPVGGEPRMFVHVWSKDFGDAGDGCQFGN